MIGQIIGNYKIEEKIGEGGMGAVYRGVDTMLDREVAIKALRPELASDNSIVERFRTEAVTLAKLNHPNIATLYALFRQGNELYMVLEFVPGKTLDTIIQGRGALPAAEAIPVFCQVLDGIDHAHDLGIVHRDIKPANMMLTERGTLKVLDFGIARLLGSSRMTRAGSIVGTLEYMAPEQIRGLETDGRSDIYALGILLYEMLTGRLPFETENEFELMKMHTEQIPVLPRAVNATIPEAVQDGIMRAIMKEPNERFQTAGDFRDALLEAGLGDTAIMHGTTGSFRRAPSSRPSISYPGASFDDGPRSEAATTPLPKPDFQAAADYPAAIAPTRIAMPSMTPADAGIKMTRLGTPTAPSTSNTTASGSVFGRLGIAAYAIAGVILLLLITGAVAIPIVFLSGGSSASNANVEQRGSDVVGDETAVEPMPERTPAPREVREELLPEMVQPSNNAPAGSKPGRVPVPPRSIPNARRPSGSAPDKRPKCTTEMKALLKC